jgi:hypothetical protein
LALSLEELFVAFGLRVGPQQLKALDKVGKLDDPQLLAFSYLLTILYYDALDERNQATKALDAFIDHVGQQPVAFRIRWDMSRLRHVVEKSDGKAVASRRGYLLGLLDAASKDRRDDILSELKRLRK